MFITHYYCLMPSGNEDEFPELAACAQRFGATLEYVALTAGGRLYRIPASERKLWPRDNRGHYLGDNDSGHSFYTLSDNAIFYFVGANPVWQKD